MSDEANHFPPVVVEFDASSGEFTAEVWVDSAGSAYIISAAHALYLSTSTSITLMPSGTVDVNPTFLRGGNTDSNGVIDLSDLACISGDFGGTPSVCESDVNGDGIVNILDLILGGGNFGLIAPQPW